MSTVLLVPIPVAAETCVSPGLFAFCVDDPGRVDAGEASAVNGDVTATANGGLVAGVGAAVFVADYEIRHDTLAADETLRYQVRLDVLDGSGTVVAADHVFDTLTASDPPVEDELRVRIDRVDPLVEGGTVRVTILADLLGPTSFERQGLAVSYAPVTQVVTPPADVADRVQVADTVQAGSFQAGPTGASADALNGSLLVAQGTAIRLEASGVLSWSGVSGADSLSQTAFATLTVKRGSHVLGALAQPLGVSCFSGPCDLQAGSVPVELSVVLPGDVEQPRSDVEVHVRANWFYSATVNGVSSFDSAIGSADGDNVLYAAGA